MPEEKYQDIPIAEVDTNGQMVRSTKDDDHITELVNTIGMTGLQNPIVVTPKTGGGYQLLSGFHRLEAFRRMRKETIPAHIFMETNAPTKAYALVENVCRRDMTLEEECEAVRTLTQDQKLSPSQICDLTGKSRNWVDQRLTIPGMPERVRDYLIDGFLTIRGAELIAGIEDEGTRNQILQNAVYGKLTTAQIQDMVEVYRSSPGLATVISEAGTEEKKVQATQKTTKICTACGSDREPCDLTWVPVCRSGCPRKE